MATQRGLIITCHAIFILIYLAYCDGHAQGIGGGQVELNTHNLKEFYDPLMTSVKHIDIEAIVDAAQFGLNVNDERSLSAATAGSYCASDVGFITSGLKSNDTRLRGEAMKFVDSSSKIPSGLLQGDAFWFGDYQECLSIANIESTFTQGHSFRGKYFSLALNIAKFPLPAIYYGVCLPDSCTDSEVIGLATVAIQALKVIEPAIANLSINVLGAYSRPETEIKAGIVATIVVSVILFLLVCIGTFLTLLSPTERSSTTHIQHVDTEQTVFLDSQINERSHLLSDDTSRPTKKLLSFPKATVIDLLKTFSFLDNSKKLFGTSTASGPLACLNGLRVLSMWWVILGHTYSIGFALLDNPKQALQVGQRFTFQPIINGTLSVDTFFFLSGLLVAYLALEEIKQKGKMNWVYFVFHRFWRLTPCYAFVMLLFVNLTNVLIDSPYSGLLDQYKIVDSCKTHWWANFLYINNMYPYYGDLSRMCMGWSWYLANDMQFYLFLSPIVILLFCKNRKLGTFVTSCLILGGIISRLYITIYYGVRAPNMQATKHTDDPWAEHGPLYGRPYARWSTYLVGMLTGCFVSLKDGKLKVNKLVALFGWSVATAAGIAVVFGEFHYYHNPGEEMSMAVGAMYIALNRTVWSLCLTWIVIACIAGKGGPVKHILSWTIWAPLGRLTYAAYLVHPILLMAFMYNLLTPLHFRDYTMVYIYIGNVVVSYGVAFAVSMLVEAPMIQLEKALLNIIKKRK